MLWTAGTLLKQTREGTGTYRIRAAYATQVHLGKGGCGITYLADCLEGEHQKKRVVIKTILDEHYDRPDFLQIKNDFWAEAFRLRGCIHSHIVQVWDLFQEPIIIPSIQTRASGGFLERLVGSTQNTKTTMTLEVPCMVQEYIQGGSLYDRLGRKKTALPEPEALKYIQQIGSALTVVHRQNMVHRDVKPENIMLRQSADEAVLIDFGLVRPINIKRHTAFRSDGYAPPEQYLDETDRDATLDVYALAATLYVLVTGLDSVGDTRLVESKLRGSEQHMGRPDPLKRPEHWNPGISSHVSSAIWQGLELLPGERPPTIADWLGLMGLSLENDRSPVQPPSSTPAPIGVAPAPAIVNPPRTQKTVPAYDRLKEEQERKERERQEQVAQQRQREEADRLRQQQEAQRKQEEADRLQQQQEAQRKQEEADRPSTVSLALRPQQVQSQTQGVRAPALLIVDPDIAEQWNIPPQEITVHRGDTLAALSSLSPQDWAKRRREWGDEVRCVTKADLFLPQLTFIAQGPPAQVFPGAIVPQIVDRILLHDVEITPLLPLNPILMSYFASEALASAVEMEPITTGKGAGVKVTLRLPLAGLNGEGKEFALSQIYDLEEENAIEDIPFLEIWPNFRTRMAGDKLEHSTWKTYYAFYGDNYADTFRVYFPTIAPEVNYSYKYKDGKQGFQLDRLTDFPSYVQCQNSEQHFIGLILLKTPQTIELTDTWTVGVDFGISYTNAYMNTGNAIQKIVLHDLNYRVTEMPESDRALVLPEFFMFTDAFTGNLPLSTVLTTRKNRSHLNRDDQQVMFDGRYYIPNLEFFDVREEYVKRGLNPVSYKDEHDCQLFLLHFLLHILATVAQSGVAEIKWKVSLPFACSRQERRFYQLLWDKLLIEQILPMTGIMLESQPHLIKESVALALYFENAEKLDFIRSTCIDIGDITSNISLWQNRDLIHQCSVQLAGRDLFAGILHRKPDFVTRQLVKAMNLGERNTLSDLKQWENLRDTAFNAKLDLFLRRFNDGLLKKRSQSEFEDSEEFQGLTTLISVGFAGLFYYVGMILSALYQEGTYGHPEITPVYLGGNGSRFLNWLDATGRFDRDSDINHFLSRMLSCGSGFDDIGIETKLSRNVKSEVACGLVQKSTSLTGLDIHLTGLDKPEPFVVAGEIYCFGVEHRSALARVQFDPEVDDINSFAIPELEQLPKFLYDFHSTRNEFKICPKVEGYKLSLNQSDNADLWRKVKRKLDDSLLDLKQDRQKKTKRAGEDVRLEPPFILALKALLNELGERWATQKFES